MSIGLTPEQEQLSSAVTQFAARHAPIDKTRGSFDALAAGELPPWWDQFVANGFHAVHLPEEMGGQGGTLTDTACVVEAAALALIPGPVLPTVTAGAVVLLADATPARQSLLGALAEGAPAAVILPGDNDFQAVRTPEGWQVSGSCAPALGIRSARTIIAAAPAGDDVVWFAIDPSRPEVEVGTRLGTDRTVDVAVVHLDGYLCDGDAVLTGIDGERARCVAVALAASASSGVVRWCVRAITDHLRTREQFGRPIGTFQALQHQAAMLLVHSELATSAAWDAVRSASEDLVQNRIATWGSALMAISPAPDLVLDTLTMFGAIGYTWEHDLHLYWRKATSLAASIGPAGRYAEALGELTRTQSRDVSVKLGDLDSEFRHRVATTLDEASALHNDKPGRQGDYDNLATGPQRTLLAEAGLIAPHWPRPWGVEATQRQLLILDEEFAKRPGLVRPSLGIAEWILPALISSAPDHVQQRLIPPTQRGELGWCQLFSEPGAGSDLASLTTRATKVDGGWRINGHKIWTSSAHTADYGALLARTDPDAAKHRGLGYFVIDMSSEGIELQPIRQATGEAHFNEVFLTDVFVPDELLLGGPTDGWNLAIATMAQERVAISGYVNFDRAGILRGLAAQRRPDRSRVLAALGEADAYANAIKVLALREVMRLLDGQAAGPASSIAKVAMNVMLRRIFTATLELSAPAALVEDSDPAVVEPYFHLPAELIGGGTKEIQLNIIAQMILGLPRA
ncbi:acyl-CoA dehydrogenase [Mycolicibacterium vaccae]|uniref:Acyl-CoA dehydrogenase domain-containing protein n=1 Tax=Mycolicibacterium vaccae ATCC 25954 TaxID=1194972 RepID=K0V508_MYCVA|nr:acyl-CoA dehydrogenase [Mycolicibacterium vaccae]ANI41178.1 acyl-CoA dehydrogenase [Mycolicibacterium vaccae 95051]EJZ12605.1 acyl-CoA dehydrogenase domain-containing protein [Mycolicibacterium vaccae ATCC 25954]MCV7063577.1 acyl-CoA dehydrogenase [Mycolicibacterium vaccae]